MIYFMNKEKNWYSVFIFKWFGYFMYIFDKYFFIREEINSIFIYVIINIYLICIFDFCNWFKIILLVSKFIRIKLFLLMFDLCFVKMYWFSYVLLRFRNIG